MTTGEIALTDAQLTGEKMAEAPAMSYAGSARRIWRSLTRLYNGSEDWPLGGLGGTPIGDLLFLLALVLIALAWIVVTLWYLVSIPLIPYRLIRRTQRQSARPRYLWPGSKFRSRGH